MGLFWLLFMSLLMEGVVGVQAKEKDPLLPRVPADQISQARSEKNPLPVTPENIQKGKELFQGKATCFTCHGMDGKGDGPAGVALDPSPRNFVNKEFHKKKCPGEMAWVIRNGSPGTGMISYNPAIISDEEMWLVILFERSLGEGEKISC